MEQEQLKNAAVGILNLKYKGKDNYGNPKHAYIEKVANMDSVELFNECETMIGLSAYANNNPQSDYHWQVDVCFDICRLRDSTEIYEKAWKKASGL